jgi:hypothetical protein
MSWARSRFAAGFFAALFTAGLALVAAGARSSAAAYEELAVFSNVLRLVRGTWPSTRRACARGARMLADLDPTGLSRCGGEPRLLEATTGSLRRRARDRAQPTAACRSCADRGRRCEAGLRPRDRIVELAARRARGLDPPRRRRS